MSRQKLTSAIVATSTAMLICGCGLDRGAGGGFGSETTNGIQVSGSSAAGAKVTARRIDSVAVPCTTSVDASGRWRLSLRSGGWAIVTESGNDAAQRFVRLEPTDTAVDVGWMATGPKLVLTGRLESIAARTLAGSAAAYEIEVPDLGRKAAVVGDSFRLEGVPAGSHILRLVQDGRILTERLGDASRPASLPRSGQGLLLENFDDGDNRNSLSGILGGGDWLVWPKIAEGLALQPATDGNQGIVPLLTDSSAWSGKSLHVRILPSASSPSSVAEFLMVLGSRGLEGTVEDVHDFGSTDSLVFMAKGSGAATVRLWAYQKGQYPSGQVFLERNVVLDARWSRVALAWRDFAPQGSTNSVGSSFADLRLLKITWVASDADLWLDDVSIPGAGPTLLMRP